MLTDPATRKKRARHSPASKFNPLEAKRFDIRTVAKTFRQIPVELMRPGTYQTRRNFKPKAMKELAASLDATGINFTPLIIRPIKFGEGYEIICGERRWRAAQMAGLPLLLCCVGDFTDSQALYLSGADNIQREDLNALEEAQAYELMLMTGMNHKEVAAEIGMSRGHVTNYVRLLGLPLTVRDMLGDERLTYAQARPLCTLAHPGQQVRIAKDAVSKGWAAKKIEAEVALLLAERKRPVASGRMSEDANIKRLIEMVALQTGYPCVIVKTPSGSWQLGLSAGSAEEFQGILDRLGVDTEAA